HSIFSIRILRIEDIGTPRVHAISELCLCDLAGSERCAKTQNKGSRLKEAGNINTSLLILGKCINALRHNQQAKLPQHVPFRESKLTHYLQGFFCGRGKACMIVNINQCASMYDETLNVLKFSAVAQKVVVLMNRPLPILPQRSFIGSAEKRRSSLNGWESSLEDVQEDENEYEKENSLMEDTVHESGNEDNSNDEDEKLVILKRTFQRQVAMVKQLQVQLKKERAESLLLEARVREEIGKEFSELYSAMQTDFNDRLVREREILQEQADERLNILKNLMKTTTRPNQDASDVDCDSSSCDLAGMKDAAVDAPKGQPGNQGRKLSELNEQLHKVQEQLVHKFTGAEEEEEEEKRRLLSELQEKSSEVVWLEKRVAELQKEVQQASQSRSSLVEESSLREKDQLLNKAAQSQQEALNALKEEQQGHHEALAALERERRAREDALAALEFQTIGKEEALASLQEERKAREDNFAALTELKRRKVELIASLEEQRKAKEEAMAALEEQSKTKEEAMAALEEEWKAKEEAMVELKEERKTKEEALEALEEERKAKEEAMLELKEERKTKEEVLEALEEERKAKEEAMLELEKEKQSREDMHASLGEEMKGKQEAQSALEAERMEIVRLIEEKTKRQQEDDTLRQEVRNVTAKLEATESEAASQTARADRALVQLQTAQEQLDKNCKEMQEKTSQIDTLTQEVQALKQELQSAATSSGSVHDQMKQEVSGLKKNLDEEKKNSENKHRKIVELEHELAQAKEQFANKQLTSDQQLQQLSEKLNQQDLASQQEVEKLRRKLQEQEVSLQQPLDELRGKLEQQKHASEQELHLIKKQAQVSEEQVEELREKLREQEVAWQQQAEESKRKLSEQQSTSDQLLENLKQKLSEQEQAAELLQAELEEARSKTAAEDDMKRLNSDLQAEVESLRAKVTSATSAISQAVFSPSESVTEMDRSPKEKSSQMEAKFADLEKAEAEMQRKLAEKEAEVKSLQKGLREARERQEEEESQAVQEARRREVERRRELLAVAEEAIAQKDAELEKRAQEISRLKESGKQDSEKIKSLNLDLQRREDDSSDLREKLADCKKQIQQVQKEISTMREEEKSLRQKLADVEKVKKQLQSDAANKDRTIQQLKAEKSSDTKSDQTLQLYQKACKDLESKERVLEDMRLALTEQEETQEQMEQALEEKLDLVETLTNEVERLKGMLEDKDHGHGESLHTDSQSDDLKLAKQEAAKAQDSLKLCTEKHQAERKKWLEEKLSLIGQAKEAEDKRNQEMRKFAEDRERRAQQQNQLESLSSQLAEKEQTMEKWRKERDILVAALEVQLQKFLSSNADKDKLIQQLKESNTQPPQESGGMAVDLQAVLSERDSEIQRLKEELQACKTKRRDTATQTVSNESPAVVSGKPHTDPDNRKLGGKTETRASVSSQGSVGYPSVLDSSEISTENGRTNRFPKPELEISFSPLQPNRMALRRQGEESAVTVKITRSARKRKSSEMDKDEVEAENKRNTKTRLATKTTPRQEESSSPASRHDSQSRKEGTLQKIGDFLQSSPTLLGSKAKKMMSLVSGRCDADSATSSSSSSSLSLRVKKNKRKLYRPEISSPMEMPSHPIINMEPEEKESDHLIIRRRLRSRTAK
ncbi:hypothetical protein LDENG_00087710, partial [Lucifuga dentata]